MDQHLSESTRLFRHSILPYEQRPDKDRWQGSEVARVAWAFTTREGGWDVTNELGSIDAASRSRWLKPVDDPEWCEYGGGSHQFTTALLDASGHLVRDKTMLYWSSGIDVLKGTTADLDKALSEHGMKPKTGARGWATLELYEGSTYDHTIGLSGPWCAMPLAPADVYTGVGMPWFKEHISTIVVWQLVPRGVVVPPVVPSDDVLLSILSEVKRGSDALVSLASWFERLGHA